MHRHSTSSMAAVVLAILLLQWHSVALAADKSDSVTLYELARQVSEQTGYTVVFGPRVKTNQKVQIYATESLTGNELYQVFLSVLKMHRYAGVRKGNMLRVVRGREARSLPMPVVVDNEN